MLDASASVGQSSHSTRLREEVDFLARVEAAGLTLARAYALPDDALLARATIGRKTLRFIRTYQGPRLPLPAVYVLPRYPRVEDFYDSHGVLDEDAYEEAFDRWREHKDYSGLV